MAHRSWLMVAVASALVIHCGAVRRTVDQRQGGHEGARSRLPNGSPTSAGSGHGLARRILTQTFTNANGTSNRGEPNPLPFTAWGQAQWDNYNPVKDGDYAGSCMPFGWIPIVHAAPDADRPEQRVHLVPVRAEHDVPGGQHRGLPHRKDWPPTWFGDSRGRWDGDALVIEAVNFNGYTKLGTIGHPMSDQAS
jgi:hypothetical protein